MSLRSSGEVEASKIVKEVTLTTPTRARKYRKAFQMSQQKVAKMSGDEALAMMIEAKLTRHQYNVIRSKDKILFPSYKIVQNSKKACYPNQEAIEVTSRKAEVNLQALLDHTVQRLIEVQKDVIRTQKSEDLKNLFLITKWGFDGSSGQRIQAEVR